MAFMSALFKPQAQTGESLMERAGNLAIWVLLLTVFCQLALVFYNVFMHPLRKIPGPPLARCTRLWARIGNFYGRKSERVHDAHLKYGPVVRVGPNELSFADPAAVRDIYTSEIFTKEESFYVDIVKLMASLRDAEAHKQRRKLLLRGFSQAAMLEFEDDMSTKIEAMLNGWAAISHRGSINVYPWLHWLGFDVVYHLMFDEDPGSVRKGEAHEVMPYLRAWRPTFIYKELMPILEKWGVYIPGRIGGRFRDVQAWKKYAIEIIKNCRERQARTPFLRSVLGGEKDAFLGRPLTDSELAEECMGGMFGGSGTTANTLVYLLWACLRRPDVVQKLHEELRQHYHTPCIVPDYKTCSTLPYLQAVINETLRLYPTIIATLPRTAREEAVVAGVTVPKGTIVGTQNYTIHRNETAYPRAEEFSPERWLEEDESGSTRKEAFTPFSVGTRKCFGIK
ncbi:uncharacterized protein A1O9_06533 [Exophiala aquamarina CBS 119918]|uniref:Cytochrome P450 oxidoreductase n=1 Tax=Exophiala aquamarina CBS 119918 TaxID=1182545 RepID=A0A072PFR6_9EURO|nr:uncharacterized protein A1O9_06533 [Exophiala aquamarina CBS 119918]KEF58607.1 hypothetical protein A1O9_06533 [Exophiala aquamarina CBS 119918]